MFKTLLLPFVLLVILASTFLAAEKGIKETKSSFLHVEPVCLNGICPPSTPEVLQTIGEKYLEKYDPPLTCRPINRDTPEVMVLKEGHIQMTGTSSMEIRIVCTKKHTKEQRTVNLFDTGSLEIVFKGCSCRVLFKYNVLARSKKPCKSGQESYELRHLVPSDKLLRRMEEL